MKCGQCNKTIYPPREKYCSVKCIKRASYLKTHPDTQSILRGDEGFWLTETGKGYRWEKYVAKLLGAEHIPFNGHAPDLMRGDEKIDVKSCELYKRKTKYGKSDIKCSGWWVFNRNQEKPMDFFCCVCLIDNKPEKILLIPADKFTGMGITVGHKSRHDKYKIPILPTS